MLSTGAVNDGKWHNVVLAAGTSGEVLYVDGQQQATLSGTISAPASNYACVGAGFLGGAWPHEPHQSSTSNTGYATYFNGDIAEVAFYNQQLSAAQVTAEYNASRHSSGLTPVEQVAVTDPVGKTLSFHYDPLNGNRLLSETDALGATTSYGYDTSGFLNTITDPNGNVTVTGHDIRGNQVSETTCQNQAAQLCSTSYYGYYPNDTSASPAPDPRNDVMLTSRDGRSSSATDNTYLTTYAYNSLGELTGVTTPAVPGFSSGRTTSYAYADGTSTTGGYSGAVPPAGLPYQETTPGGAVTTTAYYADGDVGQVSDPDGMIIKYTYDGLGRVLSKTVISNSFPNGLGTSYAYNQMGQVVTETDPPVTNRVTGAVHTAQTTTTYDADGNVLSQTVADTTGGDASRSVSFIYNANDLKASSTDAAGAITKYTYDAYGDLATQTDPAGNVTSYAYDADGRLDTVTLGNYTGDPANPSSPQNLVESSRAYDPAGRLASVTDSMGWVTSYGYTDDGLIASVTRRDPSTGASFTEQANTYDTAGNLVAQVTGNGATTTNYAVDAADQVTSQALDPAGLDRVTSYTYSADDYVTTQTLTGAGSSTPVRSESWTYDPMGDITGQTVDLQGTSNPVTTTWTLDQRGLPTSMTDPNGNITHYSYDEAGRLAVTTSPAVTTQVYGGSPVSAAPVTMTGYDTFGEPAESSDANGNVTVTAYDADGRATSVTAPPYTPPGSSSPITAVTSKAYNGLGQVTAETDPLGNKTTYAYDQLGDVATVTTPDGGVTHYTYDTAGDQLSVTGPTGAVTQATYDYLGRKVTSTAVERSPSPASYTTSYAYRTGGWLSSATSPDGVVTSYGYDAAGETTSVTDGAGNKTSYGYDAADDRTSVTHPDGIQTSYTFDGAGRPTGQADVSAAGAVLRSESAAYDGDGNLTSSTDFRGDITTYAYDATGLLTSQTQPVSATSQITTSFGHDAAGNRTVFTDGNGNNWWTTYNSWNLPESRVEPATSAYSSAADSTLTTAYDADSRPATVTEPGRVSVSNAYDAMGDLTGQSGSGADAPTASRTFGYDRAGNLTSASTTAAGSQPATAESFSYNDRGLLLSASGSAGSSSFGYNGDGQVSSATSPAGTASYSYDNAGRLASMTDPVTGTMLSYSYNPLSQLSQISYGTGADTRAFGYNPLHQLTSDTLATSSGATVASISYGYDPNGNLTSKTTTGFAGASSNTYTYDEANRLTSWNHGTTTVNYGYDGAGNRTSAGGTSYTYDARDELTSAGSTSYSYTARGTMASQSGPSGSYTLTADAYGQAAGTPGRAEGYDALGRLLTDTGSGGGTTLSYLGVGQQVTSDGTSSYSWDPAGNLTGIGTAGSGVLAWTDAHTDVVGAFTPAAASLSGSAGYDPWGTVTAASATPLPGALGFQSEYTGTGNGLVHMGARWYNPASGTFTSRDTAVVDPVPDPAAANPFAYVGDNPLDRTDPSGHMVCADMPGGPCGSVQAIESYWAHTHASQQQAAVARPAQQAPAPGCGFLGLGCVYRAVVAPALHTVASGYDTVRHGLASAGDYVYYRYLRPATIYTYEGARALLSMAYRTIRVTAHKVLDAADWGYKVGTHLIRDGLQAGSRAYRDVTTWAKAGYRTGTAAIGTAWRDVPKIATAPITYVKHHAVTIAAFAGCAGLGGAGLGSVCAGATTTAGRAVLGRVIAPLASIAVSVAVFAGCEAVVGVPTAGVGAVVAAGACGGLAGAAGNAAGYAITAAQHHDFTWAGLAHAAGTGFVTGAVFGGLTAGVGALADSLSSGEGATGWLTRLLEPGTGGQDGLSCGGLSFTAGTKVLLANGKKQPISTLKTGQKVLATNTRTGKDQAGTIAAVLVHRDTGLYDLRVRAGDRTAVIDTTSNHPFWDQDTRRWVKAGALKYGTHLRTPGGGTATVLGGHTPRQHDDWMWDLTVTSDHDFYVQAADRAVLVHNCPSSPSQILGDNMEAAGISRPAGTVPHHIVPFGARNAAAPQAVLRSFGIDINGADNGVFLPQDSSSPNPLGMAVHSVLHTGRYYRAVNEMMSWARNANEARDVLGYIRDQLQAGPWPVRWLW